MKFTVTKKVEVEVAKLFCVMGVRYWEDAEVNGVQEGDDPTIPFALGDTWKITIDLATGRIDDWPEGITAKTHYKVCDDGSYNLIDAEGNNVASKEGYVPRMLAPCGEGCGDYVILEIDEDGVIDGFKPDLSYFEDDE